MQAAVKWFEPGEVRNILHLAFPLILSNLAQPVLIATEPRAPATCATA